MCFKPPILLVLTLLAAATADEPRPKPSIESQITTATRLVATLEAENYSREPQLRKIEAEYKRLGEFFERENGRLANRAHQYLQEQDAKTGGKATEAYKALRDAWLPLHGAQAANDPVKGPLMKAYVLGAVPQRKSIAKMALGHDPTDAELKDTDKLWAAYQAFQSKSEQHHRARLAKLEKESGFPDYVLEYIRNGTLSKVTLDWVYFPYIQFKTPKELHDARFNLNKLQQQATNIPPK